MKTYRIVKNSIINCLMDIFCLPLHLVHKLGNSLNNDVIAGIMKVLCFPLNLSFKIDSWRKSKHYEQKNK